MIDTQPAFLLNTSSQTFFFFFKKKILLIFMQYLLSLYIKLFYLAWCFLWWKGLLSPCIKRSWMCAELSFFLSIPCLPKGVAPVGSWQKPAHFSLIECLIIPGSEEGAEVCPANFKSRMGHMLISVKCWNWVMCEPEAWWRNRKLSGKKLAACRARSHGSNIQQRGGK